MTQKADAGFSLTEDGPHWSLLEDMITFLVQFGFAPRYVLSRDLLTVQGMYVSAMRCRYQDKTEDLVSMTVAIAECMRGQKDKSPLQERLKSWAAITGADPTPKKEEGVVQKLKSAASSLMRRKR